MYNCGFIGIIGQPNAGKSTLMNSLVKEKVSIVTDKPQTTRRRILGIVATDEKSGMKPGQLVFVDAPGILNAKEGLNAFLTQEAQDVIEQSDILMGVIAVDTKEKSQAEKIINMLVESKKNWFLVITKVDLSQFRGRALALTELAKKHKTCFGVVEYSDKWREDKETARTEILTLALSKLPQAPQPLYDIELFTPQTEKEMVVEIIREQCFEVLHHELPYSVAVRVQKYDESNTKMPKIFAEILVAKESHKPIVVGKSGAIIKEIGSRSRAQIEKLVGKKVFLSLEVSIRENWTENKKIMKELGYVVE